MTKEIPLTQGKFALVDDDMYDELNRPKWFAYKHGRTFYARRNIRNNGKQVTIQMHRQVLGLIPGDGKECDHISRNGLDNRRENLRIASHTTNTRNRRKRVDNSSGHNGVYWNTQTNKWRAQIEVDDKRIHLGYHDELADAVESRKQGEIKYWGQAIVLP